MQGINLYVRKEFEQEPVASSADSWIYNDGRVLISADKVYPHYPVDCWENELYLFIVEGYFFEWDGHRKRIEKFADKYFHTGHNGVLINSLFADVDGEFLVIVYNKASGSLLFFNDILGRLPTYIYESENALIISRNISFVERFQTLSPDYKTFFEFLTFGFTIGPNTLYDNLKRIRGGTAVKVNRDKVEQNEYHRFDYGDMTREKTDTDSILKELKSLFVESIINRSRFADLNVLALSGGLDSRAIAGAFRLSGLPYTLASFRDHAGDASLDVFTATKIAEAHDKQLEIFDLPAPGIDDYEEFFDLKGGLLGMDMAFILNFYKSVSRMSARPALFTGDGGDKVFPDLSPQTLLSRPSEISGYAVRSNAKMDPRLACRILGQENLLFHDVHKLMESYPEKDWQMKHIHFIMDNRVTNWLVEGEDRNRTYLHSFTPFYNARIYKKLMSVSHDDKRNYRLYDSFLKIISPETYHIPNANWGFNTAKAGKIKLAFFRQQIKHTALGSKINWLRHKGTNYFSGGREVEKSIFAGMVDSYAVRGKFDIDFISKAKYLNFEQFMNICTLIKIISKCNR